MTDERRISLPLDRAVRARLRAGERLLLSGTLLTARDRAHRKLVESLRAGEALPVELAGETLYYTGPSPAPPGKAAGSLGPTTSARMDPFTPALAALGAAAFIGKGPRSREARLALREHGCLYLVAVGGAGALLGSKVKALEVAAYPELGPEAIYRLVVEDFPVIVACDLRGGYIFSHLAGEQEG